MLLKMLSFVFKLSTVNSARKVLEFLVDKVDDINFIGHKQLLLDGCNH